MINSVKKILLILSPIFVSACVPTPHKYYYISLEENSGVNVIGYGESQVDNLSLHKKMPVKYEINRENYKVYLSVDLEQELPTLFVESKKNDGTVLIISSENKPENCGFFSDPYSQVNGKKIKIYTWYIFREECSLSEVYRKDMIINFDVMDLDNRVIGRESLPFSLIYNGIYVVNDAI